MVTFSWLSVCLSYTMFYVSLSLSLSIADGSGSHRLLQIQYDCRVFICGFIVEINRISSDWVLSNFSIFICDGSTYLSQFVIYSPGLDVNGNLKQNNECSEYIFESRCSRNWCNQLCHQKQ